MGFTKYVLVGLCGVFCWTAAWGQTTTPAAVGKKADKPAESAREASLEKGSPELPEGYMELSPGMSRSGKRYSKGESLRLKVKKVGEGEYEVGDYTVKVVRAGNKVGVSCTCPDFEYRGRGEGQPCKHIWAVVLRENLLDLSKKR